MKNSGRYFTFNKFDDVEEKWVVVPEDVSFTKEEIIQQVEFDGGNTNGKNNKKGRSNIA